MLVERGLYASRARARDAINRACVAVNGQIITKPGQQVLSEVEITLTDDAARYVSRAALKLIEGIKRSGFSPHGRLALDIGASTGGFTQVLLAHGARHVIAIDVGHGQMDPIVERDHRVTNLEGVNARALDAKSLNITNDGDRPDFLVSDVSFISLKLALPPALGLAADGASGIFLIKPQFEVGRENLGKGGLVRDIDLIEACVVDLQHWFSTQAGWHVHGVWPSPIDGGDGNSEFLLAARKTIKA